MRQPQETPYVGPRPFEVGETLYGRDWEVAELRDLLIARRIVLLHSPSGAGKTSLIQAGLIPMLQEEGVCILPIVRVNAEPPAELLMASHPLNRYVLSTLSSLEKDRVEGDRVSMVELAEMKLVGYLDRRRAAVAGEAHPRDLETEVLIFDQFEEILTADPTDVEDKKEFFAQLGAALRDPSRFALFAIREDYVASLDPYLRPVPHLLSTRFRIDRLDVEAARSAIQEPARAWDVDLTDDAANKLIDDLRQVRVQRLDGSMQKQLGPYGEPVQLQVVCQSLWQSPRPNRAEITEADVQSLGGVDNALAAYYAGRVSKVAKETDVPERTIRNWFESQLITEHGFRGQVMQGVDQSRGLKNEAIRRLIDAYLVREERRRGITWYELAHDRLIEPVRRNNANWFTARSGLSTSILLRIFPKDESTGAYPVEARLDDGSYFPGGELRLDLEALREAEFNSEEYGSELFSALFAGPIRDAYNIAIGRAEAETDGRLRVRLWINDDAAELHTLPWERLYRIYKGQLVPLSTSTLTPFSRYIGLPRGEPKLVTERPIRLLFALSNPYGLPGDLHPVNIGREVENLRQALGGLQRQGQVQVTFLPGRSGLPPELQAQLEDDGYQIQAGVTSLENILRLLPGCHVFHFLGHGHFQREGERGEGTVTLYLERTDGTWVAVKDGDLVDTLANIAPQPHLVFLAACESARREAEAEHPFVGLGPKLVKAGLPAVIAMQDKAPMDLDWRLAGDFYRQLLEHGVVDRALNEVRNLLFKPDKVDWAIPVLFMRLRTGQLFTPAPSVRGLPEPEALELLAYILGPLEGYEEAAKAIVGLLEGLPLALELAARLCDNGADDLPWLLGRLKRKPALDILKLEGRESRESSVEACLALSYEGLSPDLQGRFRALGVFGPAPFDLAALAAVWDDEDLDAAGDAARALQRRGLLERAEERLPAGTKPSQPVYGQHSLLRAYALALLRRAGEEARPAGRHTDHYQRLARESWRAGELFWEQIERAWEWAWVAGPERSLAFYYGLRHFLELRGRHQAHIRWITALLDLSGEQSLADEERAVLLNNIGLVYDALGDKRQALAYYEEALPIRREVGDRAEEATTLNNIGEVYRTWGQYEQALACYEQVLPIRREVGDQTGEATTLTNIGKVYSDLGDKRQALAYYEEALPIFSEVGDRSREATLRNNIGEVYYVWGQYEQALDYYRQALPIFREVGDRAGEATTLNNIGLVCDALGDKRQALAYYEGAMPIRREVGDRAGEATTLNNIGLVYDALGDKRQALACYEQALPIRREVGDRGGEAATLNNIGEVYRTWGQYEQALAYYEQVLPIRREAGDRGGEATTLNNIGWVYDALGDKHQALAYYKQALLISREVGDRGGEAVTLNNIGLVYSALGDKRQALAYYEEALPIRREVGDRGGEAATLNNIGRVCDALGDKRQALAYYEEALPIFREVDDRGGEASTLNNIGLVYDALGDKGQALAYYEGSLPIFREVGDRGGEATTLNNMAAIYYQQGEPQRTAELLGQAVRALGEIGAVAAEAAVLRNLAFVLHDALGQTGQAIELATRSIGILQRHNLPQDAFGATLAEHQAFLAQLRSM